MKKRYLTLFLLPLFLFACSKTNNNTNSSNNSSDGNISSSESSGQDSESSSGGDVDEFADKDFVISEEEYLDRTYGGLVAQLWGNFSGLPTEFKYIYNVNPSPVPWLVSPIYETDDDTSLEYVWTHIMETYGVNYVTYEDIRYEWLQHIRDYIWCGNAEAYRLLKEGYTAPESGARGFNSWYRAIDAQIECEVFGMVAPGMKENAKERCLWWMQTVGDIDYLDCAAYYSALVADLYVTKNPIESIERVNEIFPEDSNARKMAEYIVALKETTPVWTDARAELAYLYYSHNATHPNDTLDSEINFAITIMSLVYGENDFLKTGQIALRAGFDNDCNAATACLMMGICTGYSGLPEELKAKSGDIYNNTNRPGLADSTISGWAERVCNLGKENILENKGIVKDGKVGILDAEYVSNDVDNIDENRIGVDEEGWNKEGFQLIYNPEFYHSYGYASENKDDSLTIKGTGDTITIYAQTSLEAGFIDIYVDDVKMGSLTLLQAKTYTLNQNIDHIPQVIVKRVYGLENKEHTVKIVNNSSEMVEIDSISFGDAR